MIAGETTRVLVEHLGAVDAQRRGRRVGPLAADDMWAVDEALATVLGLDRRNDRTIADLHRTNLARMASFKGLIGRLRGEQVSALTAEVAAMREVVLNINHVVTQLNHDIRSGADRSLPLFLGYSERLRLDADTAVGATQVIERQLALLDERLGAVAEPS